MKISFFFCLVDRIGFFFFFFWVFILGVVSLSKGNLEFYTRLTVWSVNTPGVS